MKSLPSLFAFAFFASALATSAAVFTVTNTADTGPGSLRQAILDANATPGADEIDFAISSGVATIQPLSSLPTITDEVALYGRSQPGYSGTPLIEIDGQLAGANVNGLEIYTGADRSIVKSLAIHGFNGAGIRLTNVGKVVIVGCYLGTDATGAASGRGNLRGLVIAHSPAATVGGLTAENLNVISGNQQEGILIEGGSSLNNVVQGNRIGVDPSGSGPLPNGGDGVRVSADFNALQGNIIAFNGGVGVNVLSGTHVAITTNSIFGNSGLGIDLKGDGVTLNDPGDGDTGANDFQNFPEITDALSSAGNLTIVGQLNSAPSTSFTVSLFWNEDCDSPSGHGEGKYFIGNLAVPTDGSGHGAFSSTFPIYVPPGKFITATASTLDNNTSEFSLCKTVTPFASTCLELDCPSNIVVECQSPAGTWVNYRLPAGTNRCSGEPLSWTCYPAPGLFAPGTRRVNCWGPVLNGGEAASCEFIVTVATNCAPACLVIQCPTNLVVPCASPLGAPVRYLFRATNLCSPDLSSVCSPPSGTVFPPGVSEVTCTATGAGQSNQCRFTVSVVGNCAPQLSIAHQDNQFVISWPALAEGYALMQADAIGDAYPKWAEVAALPETIGDQKRVVLPPNNQGAKFFKLKGPNLPLNAHFISQDVPEQMQPGERYVITARMQNTGGPWEQLTPDGQRHIVLVSQDPLGNDRWGVSCVDLPMLEIPCGQIVDFHIPVIAPREEGRYTMQWQMAGGCTDTFGELTPSRVIQVSSFAHFSQLGMGTRVHRERSPVVSYRPVGIPFRPEVDRRLHVFTLGEGWEMLHFFQVAANDDRYGVESLSSGTVFRGDFAVARNLDDRLEVFGRTLNNDYAHVWQEPGGARWSGVVSMNSGLDETFFQGSPAVAENHDGRLEVFGANRNGDLSNKWQIDPGVRWWTWSGLGGSPAAGSTPALIRDVEGRLHVFVRWSDNSIRHRFQQTRGSADWGTWESLGGPVSADPAVGIDADINLEVFARGLDGTLLRTVQLPGPGWTGWSPLGGTSIPGIRGKAAVLKNVDFSLDVYVTGTDGVLYSMSGGGTSAASWPASWTSLGGSGIASDPAAGVNENFTMEVFVVGSDSSLWHRKQIRPGVWR